MASQLYYTYLNEFYSHASQPWKALKGIGGLQSHWITSSNQDHMTMYIGGKESFDLK